MKKFPLFVMGALMTNILVACNATNDAGAPAVTSAVESGSNQDFEDGTYRGAYIDPSQVEVSFAMSDGKFSEFKFRSLGYKGESYLESENKTHQEVAGQYQQLAEYLMGKGPEALRDLYVPENIAQDADAVSSATLRSGKLISAINDGFNRGLYKLPEDPAKKQK